jgi:membrane fusion protein, multidrug efflux system
MRPVVLVLLAAGCGCGTEERRGPPDASQPPPTVDVVEVVVKPLDTTTHLEGELSPYESVVLFARTPGFVSAVPVDRGTRVKKGQLLVHIVAPEVGAQRAEAQAKLLADKGTAQRLESAAKTPGAVSQNELELAQAAVHADEARVSAVSTLEQYLTITAPFDGIITERNVHPGALVGPQGAGSAAPMLKLEEVSKLRLTVAVPESLSGAIAEGSPASFSVRAYPGASFTGTVSRVAHSVDTRTRSMPVELDVDNADGRLAPGMFADVKWRVKREAPSVFVPSTSVVQSTERTFVVRIKDGVADPVPVSRGTAEGDLVEVFGALAAGDTVALRGNEELKQGTRVVAKSPPR